MIVSTRIRGNLGALLPLCKRPEFYDVVAR
jgi:hypothetical protein